MTAKLITKDYDAFVVETFRLPESDFYNYYLNIANNHYGANNDITEELIASVERWIEWYRSQRGHHITWEVDENGNKHVMDQDKTAIPLLSLFGINRHIDKSFFDKQIDQIKAIKQVVDFSTNLKKAERQLSDSALRVLNKIVDFPHEFDFEKISERYNAFKSLTANSNTETNNMKSNSKNINCLTDALVNITAESYITNFLIEKGILSIEGASLTTQKNTIATIKEIQRQGYFVKISGEDISKIASNLLGKPVSYKAVGQISVGGKYKGDDKDIYDLNIPKFQLQYSQ